MVFFILKRNVISARKDLIAHEIHRHFELWRGLTNATMCRVQWIGDDLILATDSPKLFELGWPIEGE
jgi:hypothetical protein